MIFHNFKKIFSEKLFKKLVDKHKNEEYTSQKRTDARQFQDKRDERNLFD
jgi:hypothetical protein